MKQDKRPITWSYGGGTQSVAIAVLISEGKLPKPEWIGIADTSRESSETWEYTAKWVSPLLETIGLKIEIVPHSVASVDLYRNEELLIPAFTSTGKLDTFCSNEWKKRVIQRRLRELGYGPNNPVITWIGISLDEIGRCKPSGAEWQIYNWPLIMHYCKPAKRRTDCYSIVEAASLPRPPKSACWMCPLRRNEEWEHQRLNYPQDHEKACAFDENIRTADKHDGVWLHRSLVPLREARFDLPQAPISPLFGEMTGCDSGYCWV